MAAGGTPSRAISVVIDKMAGWSRHPSLSAAASTAPSPQLRLPIIRSHCLIVPNREPRRRGYSVLAPLPRARLLSFAEYSDEATKLSSRADEPWGPRQAPVLRFSGWIYSARDLLSWRVAKKQVPRAHEWGALDDNRKCDRCPATTPRHHNWQFSIDQGGTDSWKAK